MIIDHIRDLAEFRTFWQKYKMPNPYDFDWLVNNPHLFCTYKNNVLTGYVTVQRENGLLTLSGASARKNMLDNIEIINMICDAFDEDMYSFTEVKAAKMVLLKAGFKKVDNSNKYVRYKNGKKF
jgi:hypothetical protein